MRVHKLRALMILALLIVIGGWGLGLGGIMASGSQACLKVNPQFTDITLNRIRSVRNPGGGPF